MSGPQVECEMTDTFQQQRAAVFVLMLIFCRGSHREGDGWWITGVLFMRQFRLWTQIL